MKPLIDERPPHEQRQLRNGELLAMLSLIMALMAMAIDLMLSAFDEMRATFGLDPTSNDVAGVVTVFFMGFAVAQFVYGPLTDRFGRKRILAVSIAIYVVGAVASALAPSLGLLLAARFVWGIGAAGSGWLQLQLFVTCSRVSKWRRRCHRSWPCSSWFPSSPRRSAPELLRFTLAVSVLGMRTLVGSAVVVVASTAGNVAR